MTEMIPLSFRPNARQLRLAQAIAGLGPQMAVMPLCHAAGISERTYHRWRQQPGFRAWFAAAASATLADSTPLMLLSAMRAAIQGDNGARRLMFALCVGPEIGQAIAARMALRPDAAGLEPAPARAARRVSPQGKKPPRPALPATAPATAPRPSGAAAKSAPPPPAQPATPAPPKPAAPAPAKPADPAADGKPPMPAQHPPAQAPPAPPAGNPAPASVPRPTPVQPGLPPAPAAPPMWGYNALGKLIRWR